MSDWTVDIQDFQSIKKGKVTISSGLNIVTGPTNRGKSAIIRAIDSAIFNKATDDLVRVGASISGVTISNGKHSMTCCRNVKGKSEKTAYQFDGGTVQRKVGRTQLPEVKSMFGITEVRMKNDISMKLNFWYQNDKPFLMDKTSGQLYEFISLSSADKYVKILKQMAADIKIQEAEINNANTTVDTLKSINNRKQDFVDKNERFDELYSQIVVADAECKKLNSILSRLERLSDLQKRIDSTSAELAKVSELYSKVPVQEVSQEYSTLQDSDKVYQKLYQLLANVSFSRKNIGRVNESLYQINKSYIPSQGMIDELSPQLSSIVADSGNISGVLSRLSSVQSLGISISSLKQRIEGLGTYDEIELQSIKNGVVSCDVASSELVRYISDLKVVKKIGDNISVLAQQSAEMEEAIKSSEDQLEDFKKEVGYCPFCGSVFCKENH